MDIYVISLKHSKRRNDFDKLNKTYIKYKYFDAIDGNNLPDKLPDILKINSINYQKQAIGCAISHLSLWNKCIELQKPIVIMEDDTFVSYKFNEYLEKIVNSLSNNYDILQLCYNCDSIIGYSNTSFENAITFFNITKFNDHDMNTFQKKNINPGVAKLNFSFGTGCYVITPEGAKIIKNKIFPMDNRILNLPILGKIRTTTIDGMLNSIYKEINAFICPIPFVMTKQLHINYNSTIDKLY